MDLEVPNLHCNLRFNYVLIFTFYIKFSSHLAFWIFLEFDFYFISSSGRKSWFDKNLFPKFSFKAIFELVFYGFRSNFIFHIVYLRYLALSRRNPPRPLTYSIFLYPINISIVLHYVLVRLESHHIPSLAFWKQVGKFWTTWKCSSFQRNFWKQFATNQTVASAKFILRSRVFHVK